MNWIAAGRWLFSQKTTFCFGVVDVEGLPDTQHTEIAFAGRSNCGKSSLVNALTGHKALARTSSTPGRTQELNFFALAEGQGENNTHASWLVDMPGYGYARESKVKIHRWTRLLKDYLKGRVTLRRVFVLIDSRHGLKKNDLELLDMLDIAAISYQIILTKSDKPSAIELTNVTNKTLTEIIKRPAAYPNILQTSALKNKGLDELRAEIAMLVDFSHLRYKV